MAFNREERDGNAVSRRKFLGTGAAALALPAVLAAELREPVVATARHDVEPFELDEVSVADLQEGMKSGKWTARRIAQKYLERINEVDKNGPALNSVIEINPDALAIADAMDAERKAKGPRGPIHGVPVLLKDNIGHRRQHEDDGGLARAARLDA